MCMGRCHVRMGNQLLGQAACPCTIEQGGTISLGHEWANGPVRALGKHYSFHYGTRCCFAIVQSRRGRVRLEMLLDFAVDCFHSGVHS